MGKTLQEILDLCQEKDIQIVDFKMTDIDGRWRHLSIPVGRLNEETMQYGIGFRRLQLRLCPGGEQRHGFRARPGFCHS